jgi:RecB family endonuclease NucS
VSDLKLFRIENGIAIELPGAALAMEKPLRVLIENNMEVLFGVRFIASEHSTGKKHADRIDSLGLDENGSPVIFEYKRAVHENVINLGLFYLDWLMDDRPTLSCS